MRGPSRYMESVWSDLPSDILEKVLAFLPIASLCRFRTVAKKWNKLISHPDFAACHARASSPEEYVLITLRNVKNEFHNTIECNFEVLDVAKKRFVTLPDDFLTEYVNKKFYPVRGRENSWKERAILAADGGLFFVTFSFDHENSALFVCNPVLRTVKQLPYVAARWVGNFIRVVMSTDRTSMEYELFVINRVHDEGQPDAILIYESKTAKWRIASTIPPPLNFSVNYKRPCMWYCDASIFVKNEFYILFGCIGTGPLHAGIFSYDKVTGVVSEVGVEVPCGDADNLQLVVNKDRLFCVVSKRELISSNRCIEIFEIILARKECIRFTEMPSELVKWVLGDDLEENGGIDDHVLISLDDSRPIVATGCADSVLICSFTGRSVAYSLSNKSWLHYPDNELLEAADFAGEDYEIFGSNCCLSLYAH